MSEADSIGEDTGSIAEDTGSIAEEPDSIAHMPNVHSHRYWRTRIGILVLRTNLIGCHTPRVDTEEAVVAVRPLQGAVDNTPRVDTEEAVVAVRPVRVLMAVVAVRPLRVLMALSSSVEGVAVEALVVESFRCTQDRVLFSTNRLSHGLAQGLGPISYRAGVPFRTVGSSGCLNHGRLQASRILLLRTHP